MGQLYRKLKEYSQSEAYPFHMPGHKRRLGVPEGIREIDITEIDGFDNLHHAEGILKEAQQRAAKLYGAEETYYLVNGSTAGILAAISACVGQGGKLLMARNSHKAAYHAAEVRALKTVYLYPQRIGGEKDGGLFSGAGLAGSISPADVRRALENDSKIEAVFLTSPTYDGIVSDIKEIAGIAHSFGVPLIVDEAHGAHFGFHPYFPESSVRLGADIVIHSLHKTLPSMTQTALLHQNGVLVKRERIQKYLDIYQTSSPSYVMMACMDGCIEMLRQQGDVLFEDFAERLEWIGREADGLKHIHLLRCAGAKGSRRADAKERQRADAKERQRTGAKESQSAGGRLETPGVFAQDNSKLILRAEGRSGKWLSSQLRSRFSLELEMEAGGYAIALTSIADTQEGFERLLAALKQLDKELDQETDRADNEIKREVFEEPDRAPGGGNACSWEMMLNPCILTMAEADAYPKENVLTAGSVGRVCGEYIYLYPPGIPLIVPGEQISEALIRCLEACRREGLSLQGMQDHSGKTVSVLQRREKF